jgi:hypothetical protein
MAIVAMKIRAVPSIMIQIRQYLLHRIGKLNPVSLFAMDPACPWTGPGLDPDDLNFWNAGRWITTFPIRWIRQCYRYGVMH